MRIALDALYEGKPAPPEVLASLSDAERTEIASLARTARVVGLSLNQPIPTTEMEVSALARAHAEMARKPPAPVAAEKTLSSNTTSPGERVEHEEGNWFTRLFKKPKG